MRLKYMRQAVSMLVKEWNLGKNECGASGNICGWIYLMEILEESEKLVFYKEKGKLIGFCGYSKYDSKKYLFRKKFFCFIKKLLMKNRKIKDKNALNEYYNNYEYTPNELKGYFDGEISILIVNSDYRGKGIGKKLLIDIFEKAKLDSMNNIKILSDESCSYSFYEKLGCKKVYETIIENYEYGKVGVASSEIGYIYEKNLK